MRAKRNGWRKATLLIAAVAVVSLVVIVLRFRAPRAQIRSDPPAEAPQAPPVVRGTVDRDLPGPQPEPEASSPADGPHTAQSTERARRHLPILLPVLTAIALTAVVLVVVLVASSLTNRGGRTASPKTGLSPPTSDSVPSGYLTSPTLLLPVDQTAPTATANQSIPSAANQISQSSTSFVPTGASLTTPRVSIAAGQYKVTGSCSAKGTSYSCQLVVAGSNGGDSGGFISFFPTASRGGCEGQGLLIHSSLKFTGICSQPFGPNVMVVYSLTSNVSATRLATGYIKWS